MSINQSINQSVNNRPIAEIGNYWPDAGTTQRMMPELRFVPVYELLCKFWPRLA